MEPQEDAADRAEAIDIRVLDGTSLALPSPVCLEPRLLRIV